MNAFTKRLPGIAMAAGLCSLPFVAPHAADAVDTVLGTQAGGVVAVIVIGAVCLYFLPLIIGIARGVTGSGFLFFVNFFFGWTIVGWFGCLIWAGFGQTRAQKAYFERALRG